MHMSIPVLTCLCLVLLLAASLPAHALPEVSISPSVISVTESGDFQLSIMANGEVGALSCFAMSIGYDRLHLELVSAEEGALFGGSADPTFFSVDLDEMGRDRVSDCVLGFQTSVLPAGELVVFTLRPIMGGSLDLDLIDYSVAARVTQRMN